MAKYVFQLRRGTRYVDENGATLLDNENKPRRDDWGQYREQTNYMKPLDGELVLEYEVNPDTGKKIPRLKIGDGISDFADLEYVSVDSFVLPKQSFVTLYGSEDKDHKDKPQWEEEVDKDGKFLGRYKQSVTINNAAITPNSKIDLQPTPAQLAIFHEKDVTFVAENDDGQITVYCVGQMPKNTYDEIPVTVTEVVVNG